MKRRICATFMLLSLVIASLAGCGKKDLYQEAMSKANNAKSLEAKATMDLEMKMTIMEQEQSVSMKMDMDMTAFNDPLKMKINANVNAAGQSTKMATYLAKEGDKYMSYVQANGTWMKTAVCDADDIETAKKSSGMFEGSDFMLAKDKVKAGEDVEENGKTYKTFTGTMTKEMMKKAMESSSGITNGSVDEETLNKAMEGVKDLPYTIWLDPEEQTLYRVKFSMADMMDSIMGSVMKTQMEKSVGQAGANSEKVQEMLKNMKIEISKCDMDIIYTNYDGAEDFDIPAEALKAKETK